MKALYDHKLFVTSSRKSSIIAAINDPSNARLVMQLSSYLDPQYRKSEYLERSKEEDDIIDLEDDFEMMDDQPEQPEHRTSGDGQMSFTSPQTSEPYDLDDIPDNSDILDVTPTDDMDEGDLESSQNDQGEVAESQDIGVSKPAASDISKSLRDELNSNASTSGVNRVIKKNSELWIYYNDDINLNKIMGTVVETVESKLGSCATFNRLARSDNAIVFEVEDEIF